MKALGRVRFARRSKDLRLEAIKGNLRYRMVLGERINGLSRMSGVEEQA